MSDVQTELLGKEYADLSIEDIVDEAAYLKSKSDSIEKELNQLKKFFKRIGDEGQVFQGKKGSVFILNRNVAAISVENLKSLLKDLGREDEFDSLVSVKVGDAKKKIGTTLINKIAEYTQQTVVKIA